MTLILNWVPNLFSILYSTLWIFQAVLLVLWARSTKKRELKPKYTNLLLVIGIILLSWNVISVFLPSVGIDFFSFPDESDFFMINTIYFLYSFIPTFLHTVLAIILVLYFYNISFQYNRKSLIGPAIFLLGNIIRLCVLTIIYSILLSIDWFDFASLETIEILIDVEAIAYIIIDFILVVGFCFIFIYSIYKNNALLTMFCGLYFAILMLSLFYNINYALIEFYPW